MIPGPIRRMSSYRPLTTRSLLHPSYAFDSRAGCCQCLWPIIEIIQTFVMAVLHLLGAALAIVGCPVETVKVWCVQVGSSLASGWASMQSYFIGLFSNPSAYEALPAESNHDLGGTTVNAIPIPTPSAPPLDMEAGLSETDPSSNMTAKELAAHARAMAAAAAIQRAGQNVVSRTGSRGNSRNNSPSGSISESSKANTTKVVHV